ncbi:glycogen debranching enzyme [Pyrenophora seminiperda CCB06]|uniref:Glycogen debranching enzyme n=1 Tax=Pyrenophora seminiperda CCB06 TaxID=1302712 RepID=A0A3M7M5Y8_9PLEO|nr:glycogen debranching enzyme [Pyrenophora seminiperda CCB06]
MGSIEREAPEVVPHAPSRPVRSRLPSALRVPILVTLNLGINALLWEFASNFLPSELGAISKIPNENDITSFYSPVARIALRCLTIGLAWFFNYDFFDVSALIVLTYAPFTYLINTFYDISAWTSAADLCIEIMSFAVPTYLLRPRSVVHKSNAPLRNRFLLNSFQVQLSSTLLAAGVYVVVLWSGLRTGFLTLFLVQFFDIPTLEAAHIETPVSLALKTLAAGMAAKAFLLNPSFAAQPLTGAETPVEQFDPSTATLPQTFEHNFFNFSKRTRTLIQQTIILNSFLFIGNVQRCMTLKGTDLIGALGYAGVWVVANTVISLWFGWIGDTSADYDPL